MTEKNKSAGIKNWPKDERPREKLFKFGEHTLSNTELLAILLRSGVKGHSAIDLARSILSKFKTFRDMSHTDIRDWQEFKGLGQAKIAQIRAALETGWRFREKEELVRDIKKLEKRKKYGIVWEDKPEDIAKLCKEKLPILVGRRNL